MARIPGPSTPIGSRLAAAIFLVVLGGAMAVQLVAARLSDAADSERMAAAMGLAFCQAVAEVLGGHLVAERLDQGSRVTLTVTA